jgi:hypothetical protein
LHPGRLATRATNKHLLEVLHRVAHGLRIPPRCGKSPPKLDELVELTQNGATSALVFDFQALQDFLWKDNLYNSVC